jgi:hypothetical protein
MHKVIEKPQTARAAWGWGSFVSSRDDTCSGDSASRIPIGICKSCSHGNTARARNDDPGAIGGVDSDLPSPPFG